jgi:hypothetical protein
MSKPAPELGLIVLAIFRRNEDRNLKVSNVMKSGETDQSAVRE